MTIPEATSQSLSDAVGDLGWRYVLGTFRATVPVDSIGQAGTVAAHCAAVPGADARLALDLRRDRVLLSIQPPDTEFARRLTGTLAELGRQTVPAATQLLEIAIDTLDGAAIRPFWKAVLAYEDGPGDDPGIPLVDPLRIGPAVWFQPMDAPRPQRNRIHFDVSVPHDEAPARIAAALAAGGSMLTGQYAPAYWVLADAEGNEACITTWQGRD